METSPLATIFMDSAGESGIDPTKPFDLATIFPDTDDRGGISSTDLIAAAESIVTVPVLDGHSATVENRLDVSAGGLLIGPGGEREDRIPCTIPLGGAIINATAVRLTGDRLQRLSALVAAKQMRGMFSPDEFILRPDVAAFIGQPMVNILNEIGNDVYADLIAADGKAVSLLQDKMDELIADLESEVVEIDGHRVRLSESDAQATDGAVHAAAGLGVALGAAVDEINRQKQQERLDRADARAEEIAPVQRQYYQNAVAQQGIGLKKLRQQQADEATVRQHLVGWKAGREKIAAGDYGPLVDGIESQYNKQAGPFGDGATIAPQSTPQGLVLNHLDKDGNPLGATKPLTPDMAVKLYDEGMKMQFKFLSPAMYDKAEKAAAEQAKADADRTSRERVAGINADARMYGADTRAEAATDVAGIRADSQRYAADRKGSGARTGLSLSQEAHNLEIDAARQRIAGLSQEDILKKTQRATDSGRENPIFDPTLARDVARANRRKVGADDWFDSQRADSSGGRQLPGPSANAGNGGDVGNRFAADAAMRGMRLGRQTERGREVFDNQGRHVGYYR